MKRVNVFIIFMALSICSAPSFADKKEESTKNIPHGLQKKVDRGESLPPGWQKKLVVGTHLPQSFREHETVITPIDENGIVTVEVENEVIRLINATNEIVEILK